MNGDNENNKSFADYTNEEIAEIKACIKGVSFEKTLYLGAEAVKSFILINGGAAVAMLAFCGNHVEMIGFCSILALVIFAVGSALGGIALMFGHNAQGHYTFDRNESGDVEKQTYLLLFWSTIVCFFMGVMFSVCTLVC